MKTAAEIIDLLQLQPLPDEGGFFRQTYASAPLAGGARPAATAIYFLITPDGFSALHRMQADEIWHFYAGDPVEHLMIDPAAGTGAITRLASGLERGRRPQLAVPGGSWQGARLEPGGRWALLGCTMAPGWDDRDFELGRRSALITRFPQFADTIIAFTRCL